jgi:hypothetical protein
MNTLRFAYTTIVASVAALLTAASAFGTAKADELVAKFSLHAAGATIQVDHTAYARLLAAFVREGDDGVSRVDYARFKAEGHGELKSYIASLAATDPATLARAEQFAFWANLYNAKTLDLVLDHYPVRSIKDVSLGGGLIAAVIGGPWKAKVVTVSGWDLSLDDIEHGILRPVFRDPRVHYAVNCASIGCPNLGTKPFTGNQLDAQLDAAARAFVNHPRAASVGEDGLALSSIYSWFKSDFGATDAGVIAHLRRYADTQLAARLRTVSEIAEYRYDWSLNDLAHAKEIPPRP